jgi:hypothetical protein
MGKASELLDFIPGVGDVIGVDETKRALDRRRYLEAGLLGAGTMLGVVPVVGDVAGKVLKGAAKPAQQAVEKLAAKYGVEVPKAPKAPKVPKAQTGILATPNLREMDTASAIKAARSEPHLILGNDGYVGAPAGVSTPEQVGALRQNFDADVARGAGGADWYERARDFNKEIAGSNPARRTLAAREQALWSAQANPDTNFNFSLQGHNAYEAGKPLTKVRTGQQARTYTAARDADVPIPLGKKTGVYGTHLDPGVPPATTGTNDIWHARGLGYTGADGKAFSRALTAQEHRYMDYETLLAVERANAAKLGGRENWTAAEIQAAPWVAGKGKQLATKRFAKQNMLGHNGGPPMGLSDEQLQWGLDEAGKTYPDYANKYTAFGTYEATPGAVTGHLPDLVKSDIPTREAYAADPRSSWTDEEGRDILHDALGMYQRPSIGAQGVFEPTGGGPIEFNPAGVSRPLVGLKPVDGEHFVDPASRALMSSAEALRAGMGAQEAGAWHKPIPNTKAGAMGSVFTPLSGKRTPEELMGLRDLGAKYGIGDVVDTGQGVTMTNFYPGPPSGAATGKALKKGLTTKLRDLLPGSEPKRVKVDSDYIDFADEWKAPSGSGSVTGKMLEYLTSPEAPGALAKLDTPEIRNAAKTMMERDYELAARTGQAVREDIQNLRRIIAERGVAALKAALDNKEFLPALLMAVGAGGLGASQFSLSQKTGE